MTEADVAAEKAIREHPDGALSRPRFLRRGNRPARAWTPRTCGSWIRSTAPRRSCASTRSSRRRSRSCTGAGWCWACLERARIRRARLGGEGRRRLAQRAAHPREPHRATRRRDLSTGNLKTLASAPQWARFGELIGAVSRIRGYGDFSTTTCSRGPLDVVIESDVNILDIAALTVIVARRAARSRTCSGGEWGWPRRACWRRTAVLHGAAALS